MQNQRDDIHSEDKSQGRRLGNRILRALLIFVFILIAFSASLSIALRFPSFQNFVKDRIVYYLTEKLETEIRVGQVDYEWLGDLIVDTVLVRDLSGDSLLYATQIRTSLHKGFLALLRNRASLGDLTIREGQVYLHKTRGDPHNNLQQLLRKLGNSETQGTETASQPRDTTQKFDLDIDRLILDRVKFVNHDEDKGKKELFEIPSGEIVFKKLDLGQGAIRIHRIAIQRPLVRIENFAVDGAGEPRTISVVEGVPGPVDSLVTQNRPFTLLADQILFEEGRFQLHNYRKSPIRSDDHTAMDYAHMDINDIYMDLEDFAMSDLNFDARINMLKAESQSGFQLNRLTAEYATVHSDGIVLSGLEILTPTSYIRDTLVFRYEHYRDWEAFENRVFMEGFFNKSYVSIRDLFVFAPGLKESNFFGSNKGSQFFIEGHVYGRVNRLFGRDLSINLGGNLIYQGDFDTRNLAVKEEELINLDIRRLHGDMFIVNKMLSLDLPPNFNRLGTMTFSGRYDGYFSNFVTFGELQTSLGRAEMDMRFSVGTNSPAEYSGSLDVYDFDLGQWIENNDVGRISFTSRVQEGKGLRLETVEADLGARIRSFEYKNYRYQNVSVTGQMSRSLFDGDLEVTDDFIDLTFSGSIDFTDSIPYFDFHAFLRNLEPKNLNLTRKDLVIRGEVVLQAQGIDPDKVTGTLNLSNLEVEDSARQYRVAYLGIDQRITGDTRRTTLRSDLVDADLNGHYAITHLHHSLFELMENYHPQLMKKYNLRSDGFAETPYKYTASIHIKKLDSIFYLFEIPLSDLQDANVRLDFDRPDRYVSLDVHVPHLTYDLYNATNVAVLWDHLLDHSDLQISIDEVTASEKLGVRNIQFEGEVRNDSVIFVYQTPNLSRYIDNLNIRGQYFVENDMHTVQLDSSELVLFADEWQVNPTNKLQLGDGVIHAQNMAFFHENQIITINQNGPRGVALRFSDIPLQFVNDIWQYDKLKLAGVLSLDAKVDDIFTMEGLEVFGIIDTLLVNGDPYGLFSIDGKMDSPNNPLSIYADITDRNKSLGLDGEITFKQRTVPGSESTYQFDFDIDNYPLAALEYFLAPDISQTRGRVSGSFSIQSDESGPAMLGKVDVVNGQTKVEYLQTVYTLDPSPIELQPDLIDLSGIVLRDANQNPATVSGGIRHDRLRNFRLDVQLNSDRILVLNTSKAHNSQYYGRGFGRVEARFAGPFNQVDMTISGETGAGTALNIPVRSSGSAVSSHFVTFIQPDDTLAEVVEATEVIPRGMSLSMDLTVSPEARINIIFDERSGDIIRGNGRGNIQMNIPLSGDLEMFGSYQIESGDYLFTLLGGVINKPFQIDRGGTIRWSGDPYDASIDIKAEYQGLSTSLTNFLVEYSDQITSDISIPTQVELSMLLKGSLLRPDINFDLAFPNLTGDIKNFADSKVQVLRGDPNAMNQQVFGLIVLGTFIPSYDNNLLSNRYISSTGFNTLSEFLSNQLSIYITELIDEAFSEVGFISGVDFDIGVNLYSNLDPLNPEALQGSEVQLSLKNRLFQDRLFLDAGANFVSNSPISGSYVAPNVGIEYFVTPDRRLKVRLYQRREDTFEGKKDKFGLGLSYRREFDSLKEFRRGFKDDVKKAYSPAN